MAWTNQNNDGAEVALAIPNTGTVSFDWAVKLSTLRLPSHLISSRQIAALDLARQQTVENILESDAEWILFLDSDVLPPIDVYPRLREHNLDIVSGLYYAKKDPVHPAMWSIEEGKGLSPIVKWPDGALVEADAIGLGCTLVNRRVFEYMDKPWFRWTEGFEEHPWDTQEHNRQIGVGEDFFFCHKAKEEGFNIYVDTSIKCRHESTGVIDEEGNMLGKHEAENSTRG